MPRCSLRSAHLLTICAASLLALITSPLAASALTIDFDTFVHGDVITGVAGVRIAADNFYLGPDDDYAVAFDSDQSGTRDPDLQAAWDVGNLVGESLGRILIIQENALGCDTGRCTRPDDEGRRAAGTLTLDFDTPTPFIGFDLIDIDDAMAERGQITLTDILGASLVLDFEVVAAMRDDVVWGDNSANRMDLLFADALGLAPIARAQFRMGGSGAIDNIEYGTTVPQPSTALLMGVGLVGLGLAGQRHA